MCKIMVPRSALSKYSHRRTLLSFGAILRPIVD